MKAQPLVSIIIPTYNRAHLIGETLDSVLAQTYQNWECLVVDDGSTDGTDALMQRYLEMDARFQYHHRPKNRLKGANACRNYGFEKSRGAYISFVDSDDIISSSFLVKRVAAFNSYKCDYVIATTGSFVNGEKQNDPINRDPEFKTTQAYLGMFLSYRLPWTIMSITWKREILEKCTFDENLQRLQDVDFHIRVLAQPFSFHRLEAFDNYYRMDIKKSTDPKYIAKVIYNFCILYKKLLGECYTLNYPLQLKQFGFYFLLNFMLPNISIYKTEFKDIYMLMDLHNLLNYKEKIIIQFLGKLNYSVLGKKRGIGLYRINKHLKSLVIT